MDPVTMLSRSVLMYVMSKTTRTVISGSMDRMNNVAQQVKATTCNDCGRIYGGDVDFCVPCGVETEKLYKEYEYSNNQSHPQNG